MIVYFYNLLVKSIISTKLLVTTVTVFVALHLKLCFSIQGSMKQLRIIFF